MLHLLKIEWLKLKNYTAFKVMAILFAVGVIATNYIVYSVTKNFAGSSPAAAVLSFSPYNFNDTWQSTSYATGCILVIPALLLVMLFTNEYTFKTHRQNIIDGLSRWQFIDVKLVMALLFAVVSSLLVIITALILGFVTRTDFSLNGIENVGFFFLKALTYNVIGVLFSVLVKRTGFATGLFFIYLGAENILSQMLDIYSMRIKMNGGSDLGSIGDYLPMNAADGLLKFPDNPLKNIAHNALPTNYTWIVMGLALLYLFIFIFWSRKKFTTADL